MMKYILKVDFNEKGKKLTGKDFYNKHVNLEYKPDKDEVDKLANEDVPKELIKEVTVIEGSFVNLEIGDYVKLTEITSQYSSTYRLEKVKEITDTTIIIENYRYPFDYSGKEHSRRKNNLSTIEIPTKKEIEDHKYRLLHGELVNEITELIENDEALSVLSNIELKEILSIIKK